MIAGPSDNAATARSRGKDRQGGVRYYKRDFWVDENLRYAEPHFGMRKVAREVRRIARGRECDLLDVGCGPGTLSAAGLAPYLYVCAAR